MNDCIHSRSLVPIPNDSDELFICTICGWKFKVLHVTSDERLEKALNMLEKKGINKKDISKALELAIKEWLEKHKKTEINEVISFTEEDVKLVATQANVSEDTARITLVECKGDLARAILRLTMK